MHSPAFIAITPLGPPLLPPPQSINASPKSALLVENDESLLRYLKDRLQKRDTQYVSPRILRRDFVYTVIVARSMWFFLTIMHHHKTGSGPTVLNRRHMGSGLQ